MSFSSFYQLRLKGSVFKNCTLESVDFTESDLTSSIFDDSNLKQAIFENTILDNADFRVAQNFNIDPQKNRLKKAKFSQEGIRGLLMNYDIVIE